MGLFAFKRLREREAASLEAASFSADQPEPIEADTKVASLPKRRRQPKSKPDLSHETSL